MKTDLRKVLLHERYVLFEDGRVFDLDHLRFLSPFDRGKGYLALNLRTVKSKKQIFDIHRLVATYFVENPKNYNCVNHLDGDKLNNLPHNLEWCSLAENNQHAYKTGLNSGKYRRRKISQHSLDGSLIRYWNSMTEASLALGKGKSGAGNIQNCCNGKRNAYGYIWRYADGFENNKKHFTKREIESIIPSTGYKI